MKSWKNQLPLGRFVTIPPRLSALFLVGLLFACALGRAQPRTLAVPADFPTIQAALNNADPQFVDTVLVAPGNYQEALQFVKDVRLVSSGGPSVTSISGAAAASFGVAGRYGAVTTNTILCGFTLANSGSGVYLFWGCSPIIMSNVIVNCGVGVLSYGSSPTLLGNQIVSCSGYGVSLNATGAPVVVANLIQSNRGGIYLGNAGWPTIRDNIIRDSVGDGIGFDPTFWQSDANISQNLIVNNTGKGISCFGGGFGAEGGRRGPWIMDNTIAGNGGAGICIGGLGDPSQVIRLLNNIVVGEPALMIQDAPYPLTIGYNDFYCPNGAVYSGPITNLTGTGGNICCDPFFACQPGGDFHLTSASPCIDAGTNGAALLEPADLDGGPRILAGTSNGPAVVDLGAFEFDPSVPRTPCLFLYCPSNIVAFAPAGQESVVVDYPAPFATPGAIISNSPPAGSVFPVGDNTVTVTALCGTNVLTGSFIISVYDLARAANTTDVVWGSNGDGAWFAENLSAHDGLASVQSGAITNNQSSSLWTILLGPGTLSFWWKVSSAWNHHFLSLKVNHATEAAISGAVDWQSQSVELPPGPQLVEWVYAKDASPAAGQDAGWVDQISYSGPAAPVAVLCPSNMVVAAASGQNSAVVAYPAPVATPGASVSTWPASGSVFPLGDDSVAATAVLGTNTANCSFLVRVYDLAMAVGATNLAWATLGDAPWFAQNAVTRDGVAAAQGGSVFHGQASTLYTVLLGPGTLSFWWSVLCGANLGHLSLEVDRVTLAGISGTVGWAQREVDLGPGTHLVEWILTMDPGATSSPVTGWLDQVSYTGGPSPLSVFCPSNIAVMAAPGQSPATVFYTTPLATPGATVTMSPVSGSVFPVGDTSVAVTASEGTNIASCAFTVSVLRTNDFARALAATNLTWTSAGDAAWFVETAVARDGLAAAQSGAITSTQTSTLQTTLSGPGALSFWWKASSEANHDFLSAKVNGATDASISGEVDWQPQTIYLPSGPQLIEWTYSKDASGSAGQDAAWLAQVSYTPGPVAPVITAQPASVSVAPGLSAAFSVTAAGMPPLTYQWRFNGRDIAGATNASLVITNVQATNAGTYSVLVMNLVGSTFSAGANLTLAEVVAWGANSYGQTNVPLNLTNVVAIAGGWHHSVALEGDGTVVAWGANNAGQTNVPANLSNVVAIASRSGDHSMALRADGTVVDWGDNSYGQTNVPAGLSNVVAISAGGYRCLALKADGTAAAWGDSKTVPAGLSNIVAIAAGDYASLFLKADGTIAPVGTAPPAGLSNVIAIAAGGVHNLALRAGGTVVAWGDNSYGQTTIPAGLSNVVSIQAGDYHSIALRADGTVVVWGQYYNEVSYSRASALAGLTNVAAIAAGSDHDLALFGSGSPPEFKLLDTAWAGGLFTVSLPTQSGRVYRLEYKSALADAAWTALPLTAGNGRLRVLSDGTAAGAQRFYRVRRW